MQHPDEGTIHAWLDGALVADESAALEAHIAECAECRARVAEARGLIAASSRIVSALDVIPSGVIPEKRARARSWYATTQFRAAAAILIVAGATLLVTRSDTNKSVTEVTRVEDSETLNQPVTALSGTARTAAPVAPPAEPAETRIASKPQAKKAVDKLEKADNAAAIAERRADERAFAQRSESAQRNSENASRPVLSDVVVTGVATTQESPALRQVRADTAGSVITTVFATASGAEVTLVERPGDTMKSGTAVRTAAPRVAIVQAAPAPLRPPQAPRVAADESKQAINSITWIDKLNRSHTLSGPVSKEELEAIRKLLTLDSR